MEEIALIAAVLLIALALAFAINKSKQLNRPPEQEPMETMNLISKFPQTEEEVMQALQCSSEIATNAMRGIARIRIKMGDTHLQAYEYTLLKYISTMEGKNEKK